MRKEEIIIWLITTILGSIYVYRYGMIEALKEIRLEMGLITHNDEEIYEENKVFNFKNKFWNFIVMYLASIIIVLINTALFIKGTSIDLEDIAGIILTLGYVFLSLNAFTTAGLTDEEIDENGSALKWIVNQFAKVKRFIVKGIAKTEYTVLKKRNRRLIKKWCREDKLKVASLVEKINNQTFFNIMPSNITNESKEELKGICKFIGEVFLKNNQDLLSELKKLFNEHLLDLGMDLCFITIYLNDHDEDRVEEALDLINTRISEKVRKKATRKRQSQVSNVNNFNDLENMVESVVGNE